MTDKSVEHITDLITKIFIILYDAALVAGTAYLVEWHYWSMWTFLLAMVFFMLPKKREEKKDESK